MSAVTKDFAFLLSIQPIKAAAVEDSDRNEKRSSSFQSQCAPRTKIPTVFRSEISALERFGCRWPKRATDNIFSILPTSCCAGTRPYGPMGSMFRMLMCPSLVESSNQAHGRVGYGASWISITMSQEKNCNLSIASSLLVLLPLILQVDDVTFRCTSGAPVPIENADR